MKDPNMWLCLQLGIYYSDAESQATIVSHDTTLVFQPIRVNFQIQEVWAPHPPLYIAICIRIYIVVDFVWCEHTLHYLRDKSKDFVYFYNYDTSEAIT